MARPKKIDRPVEKTICLPQSLVARVDLELYSELEGRVPFGAWQRFVAGLIEQYFQNVQRKDDAASAAIAKATGV